ncbi:MAG: NAD-dependent epimerase/dehydratase family protein [Candidatus Hodarchaeota archaeon]
MNLEKISDKNVVVTGAAGFIGSHLVDKLVELGNNVIGIDNFLSGRRENLSNALKKSNFKLAEGDIRDLEFLSTHFKEMDVIFHEAALTSVPGSVEDPKLCNEINVTGTLNVLEISRKHDISKVVFASSCAIYGDSQNLPNKEDMGVNPVSPYGVSKLAAEAYVKAFHETYGLDTTALRYFNVFGPRQRDNPYSGVIAIFFGCISRKQGLNVFGDGKQTRDFVYVKDVVDANLLASTSELARGKIINVPGGSPITINELARTILDITGNNGLNINHKPPREGDILHSHGDISRANALLGFTPKFNMKSGLKDYLNYLDENFEEKV